MAEQDNRPGADYGNADEGSEGAHQAPLPQMNFSTFIFSLNHTALMHLGAINDPATGQSAKNIELAKQTIDILAMLEEKTQGNLTEDESQMIKSILYDLRMIYVREQK